MAVPPQPQPTQNHNVTNLNVINLNVTNTVNDPLYIASSDHPDMHIEKQKQVTNHVFEPTAFFANLNNKGGNSSRRDVKNGRNDSRYEVKKLCTYCNQEGHTMDQCFEKIGYLDWYKGKKAKKSNKLAAHVNSGFDEHFHGDTPFDMGSENEVAFGHNGVDQKLEATVCQEMIKMFKGKNVMEDKNYASAYQAGAYDHMTPNISLFISTRILKKPIIVHLPDVGKLIQTNNLTTHFYPNDFMFHDLTTKEIVAVANAFGTTDPTSYHQAKTDVGWVEAMNKELAALEANNTWVRGKEERQIGGYIQSKHDYSLFVKQKQDTFTVALVYVDDVLITGNSEVEIVLLKEALDKQFTIKDLRLAKYFLRIELCTTSIGTHLNQRKYIVDLLSDIGLTVAKPVAFPLPTELKLTLDKGTPRKLVAPKDVHMQAAMHLLRSSTEAEYRAMAATTCELLLLSYLLQDLQIPVKLPVTLFCDNKASQQIAANLCFHDRTKHLEIDCHFTKDKVQDGFLQTAYIPTHLQLADLMTKALGKVQHSFLNDKLGISDFST
nr:hypothetical protein [Tanacetum cinerariifolium]